jgi:hypothetical protein
MMGTKQRLSLTGSIVGKASDLRTQLTKGRSADRWKEIRNSRHPEQSGTGGKVRLLGISKR